MNSASSLRRTASPIPPVAGRLETVAMSDPRHLVGGLLDGRHDVLVAGAAADVALERVPDLALRELALGLLDDADGGHHHARRAVAALEPVMLVEGPLDRVQLAVRREALDGADLRAIGLDGEDGARQRRHSVDLHRAGAARARVTADVGARQPEVLA